MNYVAKLSFQVCKKLILNNTILLTLIASFNYIVLRLTEIGGVELALPSHWQAQELLYKLIGCGLQANRTWAEKKITGPKSYSLTEKTFTSSLNFFFTNFKHQLLDPHL